MTKLPSMKKVHSSNLDAIGYSEKLGLVVRFKSGGTYHYPKADKGVYDGALEIIDQDKSIGAWFAGVVRGRYTHRVLDD